MPLELPIVWAAMATLAFPALAFVLVALIVVFRRSASETWVVRVVEVAFILDLLSALAMAALWFANGEVPINVGGTHWFGTGVGSFPSTLLVDRVSITMAVLSATLVGLVGRFSRAYLHREPGFGRFFMLLALFGTGIAILVLAGSFDLLFIGWEMLGVTSVFLIAFFESRSGPVRGATRAFVTYRACDLGLLAGALAVHDVLGTSHFIDVAAVAPLTPPHVATRLSLFFLVAAIGKSAQFPVTGWLPRAMEGPTPSSALCYGGLSVHAGAYLLLRIEPLLQRAPGARAAVVGIGALTAILSASSGRAQTDAKNTLAYASAAQAGVIFVEIGLGFPRLALAHMVGHACLRTFQLLRAPSALADAKQLHADAAGRRLATGGQYERLLPVRLRTALYALAVDGFQLDAMLERFVVAPVLRAAESLERVDRRMGSFLAVPAPRDEKRGTGPE